jgi:hypothetical protein
MPLRTHHRLLLRVSAIVAGIVGAKLLVHWLGWEIIAINPLFSGIVAGNVFLMGFLLSGVLSDFKESERLPGEVSACLENLAEEARGIGLARPEVQVSACLLLLSQLGQDILGWFRKTHRTADLLAHLNAITEQCAALERQTQAALVARMKQEQGNLRRTLIRIHTIRETSFISSGYLLVYLVTTLLCLGLLLAKIERVYESLFYVGVIAYLMIYLLLLIRDLDNPFGYYERFSEEDVSLKPIEDAARRLAKLASSDGSPRTGSADPCPTPAAAPRR